jgi:putative chitinase
LYLDALAWEPGALTGAQLRAIMPTLKPADAERFAVLLEAAMNEFGIKGWKRRAAFLAQIAHESGELKYMEELASGKKYEGREDLGNIMPGDGKRFKGHGPLQITGRANHRAVGLALGLDLENNPKLLTHPPIGMRAAAWFWKTHGLNELADEGDFNEITRIINGGYNHLSERKAYHKRARRALAPEAPPKKVEEPRSCPFL